MADDFRTRYGPVALVTGASSGIGLAFAHELAARGLDLAVAARRTERLEALAGDLASAHGTRTRVIAADLADPQAPAEVVAQCADLDVGLLVSNAGFNLKGRYEDKDPSAMAKMLMVNCHAPMQLAHGLVARLRARGRGGIVFTASVEGLIGCPYSTAYAASKALVIALGEGLWGELHDDGIDVLTLCPGATESEATAKYAEDYGMVGKLQPADEVARMTLDNLANGPTFVPHAHYRAMFEQLAAMPRKEALTAMAEGLKAAVT